MVGTIILSYFEGFVTVFCCLALRDRESAVVSDFHLVFAWGQPCGARHRKSHHFGFVLGPRGTKLRW